MNFGFKRVKFSYGHLLKQLLSVKATGRRSLASLSAAACTAMLTPLSELRDLARAIVERMSASWARES